MLRLQFIGCGDAFGSGGRLNTCFHLVGREVNALIDCGASSLVALNRYAIHTDAIDTILITHFHADHFGGIPFLMLNARYVTHRQRPLTIAGPPGLEDWYERVMETAYAASMTIPPQFALTLRELTIAQRQEFGALAVTPFHVVHDDRAGPCLALRIEAEGKVITYSGDTEWTPALIEAAHAADLFICECYTYERPVAGHLSLTTLTEHFDEIGAKRIILTHLGAHMLGHRDQATYPIAEDGLVIEV
jgi:ribonuclease BN (tRNA processing enzyme)